MGSSICFSFRLARQLTVMATLLLDLSPHSPITLSISFSDDTASFLMLNIDALGDLANRIIF